MQRAIDDKEYIESLPSFYHKSHEVWKQRMLSIIDGVVADLETLRTEEVMEKYQLTLRDMSLLVQLGFFSQEEVERFNLRSLIEVIA